MDRPRFLSPFRAVMIIIGTWDIGVTVLRLVLGAFDLDLLAFLVLGSMFILAAIQDWRIDQLREWLDEEREDERR